MRVRTLVVAVTLVGIAAFATAAIAQAADPWIGTWKLDTAKSKYSPGPSPQSSTITIEAAAGGIKQTTDTTPLSGPRTHAEVTAKFDGRDYPVKGNPNADMEAYTTIDAIRTRWSPRKAAR